VDGIRGQDGSQSGHRVFYVSGHIRTFESPSVIEQVWDFGEQEEESLVRIELFEEPGRTRIELIHTNIPDEAFANIEEGWRISFLGTLKSYLEN
jgi:uncharacterized protein YndB with AHSA1/START domain